MSLNYSKPALDVSIDLKRAVNVSLSADIKLTVKVNSLSFERKIQDRAESFKEAETAIKNDAARWLLALKQHPVRQNFSVFRIDIRNSMLDVGSGTVAFRSEFAGFSSLIVEVENVRSLHEAENQAWARLEQFLDGAEAALKA